MKASSHFYDHYNTTGHITTVENFSIVGREEQNLARSIKDAIFIRVNDPPQIIGKYHLPHILNKVMVNTPERKLQ